MKFLKKFKPSYFLACLFIAASLLTGAIITGRSATPFNVVSSNLWCYFLNGGLDDWSPCSSTNPLSVTVVGTTGSFGANPTASITRSANTTTYTANTGWNNGTPTFFSLTGACRANGTQVLVPQIDVWSSANPTTKLQGILWLFSAVPGTNVSDNANFNIAAADYANLTGPFNGIPFTLTANQGSGAANSGVSLTGTTYQMQCASGTTTITGMVQVVNAYVPANAEVLHVGLRTVGVN